SSHVTSPPRRTSRSIFSPEFLKSLDERDDVLTASEAAYAGPWKSESVPGRPGEVGVLRLWEHLDAGDEPEGVFQHDEIAALFAALLPLTEREPLFYLGQEATAEGYYPVTAVYGEQGPQVVARLRRYEPRLVEALHLFASLVRSPAALAAVMEAAGSGLVQAGRILAPDGPA
ncbi:MAG TPA: hypothetical protein VEG34_13815, partial [Thermoanaerobaculia bacterium]|nr:hypothetical protein [Thermoanaerobaculia bacterium]